MKVEQLFAFHRISEERKVPLATLSFQGNAMNWWTTLKRERHLHKDPPITYWNDLRGALRCRHIPSHYNRKLMDKLQRLHQRNLSAEEYWQKMVLYIKSDGIELLSFMVFVGFAEALMGCRWIKALLGVVVALEVHEE